MSGIMISQQCGNSWSRQQQPLMHCKVGRLASRLTAPNWSLRQQRPSLASHSQVRCHQNSEELRPNISRGCISTRRLGFAAFLLYSTRIYVPKAERFGTQAGHRKATRLQCSLASHVVRILQILKTCRKSLPQRRSNGQGNTDWLLKNGEPAAKLCDSSAGQRMALEPHQRTA